MENDMTLDLENNVSSSDRHLEEAVSPLSSDESVEQDEDKGLDAEEAQTSINSDHSDSKENVSDDGSTLTRIELICEHLSEQISAMETLFSKRIMHTEYEDKIIDQMHSELQRYKEDLYSQMIRAILLDVIEVRDSIMRNAVTYLAKPKGEQSIPNDIFATYACDLQNILEKNNVEIYRSNSGDSFVPLKQRVVKKEITDYESLHGKIAESLSNGYNFGGRVISAEKVSVYLYQKTEKDEGEDK